MKLYEFETWANDGLLLFGRKWIPEQNPKGVICLVHGLGEHSGRYEHVAAALTKEGYAVAAFDQRGHGKSQGRRGDIPSYEAALDDISHVLEETGKEFAGSPLFLYGHSLGGNLVLNYVLLRKPRLAAAIVTSPWLKLAFEPHAFKVMLANIMNKILPAVAQSNGLVAEQLSHDPVVVNSYTTDPLVHDRISVRLFFNVYRAGNWALENAASFQLPLLLMHGESDSITSWEASQKFADQVNDHLCTFKLWPGLYHELHNELGKEQIITFMLDWVKKHS